MAEDAQLKLPRNQVAATEEKLAQLRKAAKGRPTREELASLRTAVKEQSERDDVKIVELDGPMAIWSWLCKRHRENLKPGWFVKQVKDAPHPLTCEKCARGMK